MFSLKILELELGNIFPNFFCFHDFIITQNSNKVNIILSHTCPYKCIQNESKDYSIDQSTIDYSTEYFLDEIEETTDYDTWYCGHYHIDKHINKIRFMHKDIDEFKKLEEKKSIYIKIK